MLENDKFGGSVRLIEDYSDGFFYLFRVLYSWFYAIVILLLIEFAKEHCKSIPQFKLDERKNSEKMMLHHVDRVPTYHIYLEDIRKFPVVRVAVVPSYVPIIVCLSRIS